MEGGGGTCNLQSDCPGKYDSVSKGNKLKASLWSSFIIQRLNRNAFL